MRDAMVTVMLLGAGFFAGTEYGKSIAPTPAPAASRYELHSWQGIPVRLDKLTGATEIAVPVQPATIQAALPRVP